MTAALGAEFDVGDAAEEVDTLGGYLFTKIGRVPVRGELVAGPGNFEIEIVDADPRRVKRLRIYRKKGPPAVSDGKRRKMRSEHGPACTRRGGHVVTLRRRGRTSEPAGSNSLASAGAIFRFRSRLPTGI